MVSYLENPYTSYGFSIIDEYTEDKQYLIQPLMRLILVKIQDGDRKDYQNLKEALEAHYKKNKIVNNVYLNTAGIIVIDCRR